ncbi:hypothetical protein V1638_00720 [Pseudarthrobacter sp. J64]|uniref:hypothetical protein n=1 Tax=Pseudarthrobacter sp. J64 TaxID=3116485 RepID=UPI002E807E2C|nr:hypothetical protein [Pseudarthrobacter sp. J64]MEE2567923.1 hypothetical protein [Pseudarthrobacter sp. J64]
MTNSVKRTTISSVNWDRQLKRRLFITDALVVILTVIAARLLRFGLDEPLESDQPVYDGLSALLAIAWLVA